jgi:magnesium-dependent phosphatase 1
MMSARDTPWLYPQALAILKALEHRGIQLALASRTPTPDVAAAFLEKLSLRERFCRWAWPGCAL